MQDHQNMPAQQGTKDILVKSLKIASIALVLAPFPKTLLAEEVSNATSLETLTVEGNALYDAASSEELTGYNVEAATVGTKTPAALKDIPQSITVLTNDFIEDRGAVYLDDIAKTTPGLVTLTNDSGRSSIYARGYEYDDVLIDGLSAPISSQVGSLPSLSAFDSIEIMRGPAGLFSSTSEMGGILNLKRKRATEESHTSISAGVGSWGRYNSEIDTSGPLNEDGSARGRLVYSKNDASSQKDGNDNINESVYATLDIDLDENTELSLGILSQSKDITPSNGLPSYEDGTLLDIDRSTFFGADWNTFTNKTTDLFADVTRQFDNGGRGHIAARYSERSSDYNYAYTGSNDKTISVYVEENGDFSNFTSFAGQVEQTAFAFDASYSQPFEVMGNVSEFVVGADFKREDTSTTTDSYDYTGTETYNIYDFDSSLLTKSLFDYTGSSTSTSAEDEQAIYGKVTFRPIADLALITGARVSNYGIESGTDSGSGSHFTPYGGFVYDLTESQALYGSYSEVFKPQTSTDENGDFIDPREGEQFELGIKGSYANGLLNSRFTVFQLTDKNRAAASDDGTYSVNTGEYRVRGFEAELAGQLGPWDALVGYSYLDTEVLEESSGKNTFSLMPQHSVNAWAKYNFGESSNSILNELTIGAGLTAVSSFETSDGLLKAPEYTVIDTSISKQLNDNLKVSLNINNLLDEKYYSRVGATSTFNFYGPSRNFMANATYTF